MYWIYSVYFIGVMLYGYHRRKNDALLAFSCFAIAFLAAIRYRIGIDYDSYLVMFRGLLRDPNSRPQLEVGWRYITHFLSYLGFNEYGCFAFWAFATMTLVYYGIKKYSPYPLISCSIFFFAYTLGGLFSGMRQIVASTILVLSLDVIKKRKHVTVCCISLLTAICVHKVAIVIIPIYFLVAYDNIIGKHKYWILFASLGFGVLGYCVNLILFLLEYLPGSLSRSIETCISISESDGMSWGVFAIARRVGIVLIALYLFEEVKKRWEYCCVAVPLFFWGNAMAFLLLASYNIAGRTGTFLKIMELLIFPSFLLVSDNPHWRRGVMVFILCWCLGFFYLTLFCGVHADEIYPFKTIFEASIKLWQT
ncbi:MAG: EpsG family protein [Planctomycetia bacterium]|jgi:hypothetical protein